MQKITTFLAFDGRAGEAFAFYQEVFPGARAVSETRPDGKTLVAAELELFGQRFGILEGGPSFRFAQGISLLISCESQDEVDRYWDALIAGGGAPGRCGWLTDKFGVSWQVVPTILPRLFGAPERDRAGRAIQAMMTMQKLDIAALQRAFDGN